MVPHRLGKGALVIDFYTPKDLDALYTRLMR
jgi:hypothetical protein